MIIDRLQYTAMYSLSTTIIQVNDWWQWHKRYRPTWPLSSIHGFVIYYNWWKSQIITEATSAMCTNKQYNFELSHKTCRRISQYVTRKSWFADSTIPRKVQLFYVTLLIAACIPHKCNRFYHNVTGFCVHDFQDKCRKNFIDFTNVWHAGFCKQPLKFKNCN